MKETFFEAFFSLARLFLSVKDNFLKQKLVKKTKDFFMAAQNDVFAGKSVDTMQSQASVGQTDFLTNKHIAKYSDVAQPGRSVAQYRPQHLFSLIDDLNEFIDILVHFKISDLSPALLAKKNLLRFYLEIINHVVLKTETATKSGLIHIQGLTLDVDKSLAKRKTRHFKEKIIDYLKTKPLGVQAKEMVSIFRGQFSRRTLQRHLNDLVKEDIVVKNKDEGFSKYNILQDRIFVVNK